MTDPTDESDPPPDEQSGAVTDQVGTENGTSQDGAGDGAVQTGTDDGGARSGGDDGAARVEAEDGSAQVGAGIGATRTATWEESSASRYAVSADCTHEEFLAAAKLYAREVVDRHDLSAAVGDLEWDVSTRAKRRAGAVKWRDGEPQAVVLTWEHFLEQGWAAAAATIRHELAHVHQLNEDGDASHGPAFRRLADRLDTHVHCERFAEPKWWVTCRDCGARLARYRRSKLVANPDEYRCGDCGGDFRVERND